MKMKNWIAFAGLTVFVTGLLLWRLLDHDLDLHESESIEFTAAGQTVTGTVWLPVTKPVAVVVLVHCDDPQDRCSFGGYAPIINTFLDHGIAVAAWDKPGVGRSEGNWLNQSMADRTAETRLALAHLGKRFKGVPIGAIGFSQAGWVLPRLTDDANFLVHIGPAVSWRDQAEYFTRTRLRLEGSQPETITNTLQEMRESNERLFGNDTQISDVPDGMSQDRWHFVRENRNEDA